MLSHLMILKKATYLNKKYIFHYYLKKINKFIRNHNSTTIEIQTKKNNFILFK
jgi:hypothetical protein